MERERILDRYRLALALVPDETAAGDLFMESRSDGDLCRRAARWRARQGLPPLERPPLLPDLDDDQAALALHLAMRAGRRRRWRSGALLAAAVLCALALGSGAWPQVRSGRPAASPHLGFGAWPQVRAGPPAASPQRPDAGVMLLMLHEERQAGPFWVSVESVELSSDRTVVRYRTKAPEGLTAIGPYAIEVGAERLSPVTGVPAPPPHDARPDDARPHDARPDDATVATVATVATFGPLPAGVTNFTLTFRPPATVLGEVVYLIPDKDTPELSALTVMADRAYCLFTPRPNQVLLQSPDDPPYFTDREGRRYPVLDQAPQSRGGLLQYPMVLLAPPPGVQFVSLTLPRVVVSHPVAPVQIDLIANGADR